jgi:hypothetical protein
VLENEQLTQHATQDACQVACQAKKIKKISHNRKKIPCVLRDPWYLVCMKDKENQNVFQYGNIPCILEVETDYEEDCVKDTHYLVNAETGESVAYIPWSPYSCPSVEDINLWIALGAPSEGFRWNTGHPSSRFNLSHEILDLAATQGKQESGATPILIHARG